MNERIKELMSKAEETITWKEFGGHGYVDITRTEQKVNLEKFAELIVGECAELSVNSQYTNTKSEYYEGFNEALIYAGNKIRKHFGVEQ